MNQRPRGRPWKYHRQRPATNAELCRAYRQRRKRSVHFRSGSPVWETPPALFDQTKWVRASLRGPSFASREGTGRTAHHLAAVTRAASEATVFADHLQAQHIQGNTDLDRQTGRSA
jgi:hypothetical protein